MAIAIMGSFIVFAIRGSLGMRRLIRLGSRWGGRAESLHRFSRDGYQSVLCRYSGLMIASVWSLTSFGRYLRSK